MRIVSKINMFRVLILTFVVFSSLPVFAQNEKIDNKTVIEMSRGGLPAEIIMRKIASSSASFDVSARALIELKTAGVGDDVIGAMMENSGSGTILLPATAESSAAASFSESGPGAASKDSLTPAKTIAFGKSSAQPSRQALEKELMKRKDFQQLNLTILRYKEAADLFVDIGFVSGSLITHRYVYRIYDRRSGAVIAAGETTSWGSLAENLARHIAKSLTAARKG